MTSKRTLRAFSAEKLFEYDRERGEPERVTGQVRLVVRPELLRCDECGQPADSIHFVTGGGYPHVHDGARPDVLFACPDHDPGGYWLEVARLLDSDECGARGFVTHIAEKRWGLYAVAALAERLDEIDSGAFHAWLDETNGWA